MDPGVYVYSTTGTRHAQKFVLTLVTVLAEMSEVTHGQLAVKDTCLSAASLAAH